MTKTQQPQAYKPEVREQYEDFPYPFRDVAEEGKFIAACDPYSLMALSHQGWGGMRDLRRNVRILVAGCGTGDAVIQFAEELLGSDTAEIVAIDLSAKSLEIAKARMAKRKLNNVTFHHMSILDAPDQGLGTFDIIDCSGVLHHLPDPNVGLGALASMLKNDGLMAVMVYGQYGRMSIYMVQALMRQLITEDMPRAKKIAVAREFLNFVPTGHWITVNNDIIKSDVSWPDGSGIYDLFLHSTDRAYTVPQLYDWVEGQGLRLGALFSDMTDDSLYTPESYSSSESLRAIFATKSLRERQTIAELMNGNIPKHSFYAAKKECVPAQLTDDMVITYGLMQSMFAQFTASFLQTLKQAQIGQRVEGKVRPFDASAPLFLTKTTHVEALIPLIDGVRTVGEMVATVVASSGGMEAEVRHNLEILYKEYRSRQIVFLRHKSIPPYVTGQQILDRVDAAIRAG